MTMTTRLFTYFRGEHVGTDAYGNRYFRFRQKRPARGADGRDKRWVLYNGVAEPSRVPPEWFRWLHYTTDTLPDEESLPGHAWQKPHMPNLSGTPAAHLPAGHLEKGGEHAPTVAKIGVWEPGGPL